MKYFLKAFPAQQIIAAGKPVKWETVGANYGVAAFGDADPEVAPLTELAAAKKGGVTAIDQEKFETAKKNYSPPPPQRRNPLRELRAAAPTVNAAGSAAAAVAPPATPVAAPPPAGPATGEVTSDPAKPFVPRKGKPSQEAATPPPQPAS
jgi:hypothetical protein